MTDKRGEHVLRAFLEGAPGAGEGATYLDETATAVYKLEPTMLSAILCGGAGCDYIGLVLSVPKRATWWQCPRCGRRQYLTPPAAVLLAPDPPASALNSRLRRRAALARLS